MLSVTFAIKTYSLVVDHYGPVICVLFLAHNIFKWTTEIKSPNSKTNFSIQLILRVQMVSHFQLTKRCYIKIYFHSCYQISKLLLLRRMLSVIYLFS